MSKTGMVLFGITLLGGGATLAYALSKKKTTTATSDKAAMMPLLDAACQSSQRGDRNGFFTSVQAAGTLLDGNAQPKLAEDAPNGLYARYQGAIASPTSYSLCEVEPSLLGLANELAAFGYDYESGQILRIALSEAAA